MLFFKLNQHIYLQESVILINIKHDDNISPVCFALKLFYCKLILVCYERSLPVVWYLSPYYFCLSTAFQTPLHRETLPSCRAFVVAFHWVNARSALVRWTRAMRCSSYSTDGAGNAAQPLTDSWEINEELRVNENGNAKRSKTVGSLSWHESLQFVCRKFLFKTIFFNTLVAVG